MRGNCRLLQVIGTLKTLTVCFLTTFAVAEADTHEDVLTFVAELQSKLRYYSRIVLEHASCVTQVLN